MRLRKGCNFGLIFAYALFTLGLGTSKLMAANGTASYIDFNGATAGFGTPGAASETATIWSTSANGDVATTARPTSSQLTIGNLSTDFAGQSISINLDGGGNLNGVLINGTSVNVTFTGTSNTHLNADQTWTVPTGSTLTVNDTRQPLVTGDNTVKGMNWNNKAATFQGGGIINFPTPFGANSTNTNTENMPGGTINLQMGVPGTGTGANTYSGGFTLTAGTLNFASAGSASAFNGFLSGKTFAINGGIIDNTTAAPITVGLGAGSYSIGGDFTFTGTRNLSLGTAAVTLTGNRQITVGGNTLTIGGVISGSGFGLTKAGAGTLLLSGANTYTGNTTVSGGILQIGSTGSLSSSSGYTVGSGATLDVSALGGLTLSGSQSLTNNGTVMGNVTVGGGTSVTGSGTFSNNLSVSGGLLNIKINGATSDQSIVTQTATFTGNSSLNVVQIAAPTAGSYTVLSANSLSGLSAGFLQNVGRTIYSIDGTALGQNKITLNVTGGPAHLTWTGADPNSSQWDNLAPGGGTAANWTTSESVTDQTHFYDGDAVTFAGAGPSNISISGTVSPGSMAVTAGVYSIGGGTIAGPAALTLSGTGSLTLTSANSFAGGTTIGTGSTLSAAAAGALGTGAINLNGGTLNINNAGALNTSLLTIAGGSTLDNTSTGAVAVTSVTPQSWNGSFTFVGAIDGSHDLNLGTGAVNLNSANPTINVQNGTLTVGGVISGAGNALTKDGAGTLVLGAINTYSGGTTVNGGTLKLAAAGSGIGDIRGILTINSGGTVVVAAHDVFGFNSAATGVSVVNINKGGTLDDQNPTPNNETFTGITVNMTGGTWSAGSTNFFQLFSNGFGNTTINTLASDTTSTISTRLDLRQANLNSLFTVAAGTAPLGVDLLVSGNITQNTAGSGITKAGPGKMVLSGNNTYTGPTAITGGTLALSSSTSDNNIPSSAAINVSNGATFDVSQVTTGNGFTLGNTTAQTLTNGGNVAGTLSIGTNGVATGSGSYGAVKVVGGKLTAGTATNIGTLSAASIDAGSGLVQFKIGGANGDLITVSGTANFASNSQVAVNQLAFPSSSSYTVLTAGTLTGLTAGTANTFGRINYDIDATALAANTLKLNVVGSPGTLRWTGADGGLPGQWDNLGAGGAANWQRTDAGTGGDPNRFYDFDTVVFDGLSPGTVSLAAAVSPTAITVSAGSYTVGGSGKIAAGSITVGGTGNLTISASVNSFAGGTTINAGGTLTAAAAGAVGTGPVNLAGGTLNVNNAAALNTSLLTITGGALDNTSTAAITLSTATPEAWNGSFTFVGAAGGTHDLNLGTGAVALGVANPTVTVSAGTLTVGGVISGAGNGLTKAGGGTLVLTGDNTYGGGATVNGGTLQVNRTTSGKTPLGSGNTTVNAGGTLVGGNGDAFGFTVGSSPATIFINGGTVTDLPSPAYRVTLRDISFTGGTLTNAAGATGDANGHYSLFAGTVESNAASTTAVISAGVVSLQNGATTFTVAPGTVTTGPTPGVDLLVSSVLKNFNTVAGSVTKAGNGTMQLNGANTYTGATAINAGALLLNGTHTGGANYTVASGATLGGTGSTSAGVLVNNGGNLSPGTVGIGTFGVGSAAISGTLKTDLSGSTSDLLNVTGTLDINAATANFNILAPLTKTNFTVAHYGSLSGIAFGSVTGNLPAGTTFDYLTGNNISLTVPAKSLLGNFNLDSIVDKNDIPAMLSALTDLNGYMNGGNPLGSNLSIADMNALGDFDHSGNATTLGVNNRDIQLMLDYIASLPAGGGGVAAVPEPASFVLLGLGFLLCYARRRSPNS